MSVFGFLKFLVELTPQGALTVAAAERAPLLGDLLRKRMVKLSGEGLEKEVSARVPSLPELKDYKNGFRTSSVKGAPSGIQGTVVHVKPKKRKVKELKKTGTLIVVKLRANKRASKEAKILAKHSPWTTDTYPKNTSVTAKDAIITYKKVHPSEVIRARSSRNKDRRVWTRDLAKATSIAKSAVPSSKVRASGSMYDVGHTADQLEGVLNKGFGERRVKRPHWGPGLITLKKRMHKIAYAPEVQKMLGDPNFHGAKKYNRTLPGGRVDYKDLSTLLDRNKDYRTTK